MDIWLHIATDNPAAADRVLDHFSGAETRLARHPELGHARPDIAPDLRLLVVGQYLMLYRRIDGGVEIVRVTHGARDIANLPLS